MSRPLNPTPDETPADSAPDAGAIEIACVLGDGAATGGFEVGVVRASARRVLTPAAALGVGVSFAMAACAPPGTRETSQSFSSPMSSVPPPDAAGPSTLPYIDHFVGPTNGGPLAIGQAPANDVLFLYAGPGCSGSAIHSTNSAADGSFSLPFPEPSVDALYSVGDDSGVCGPPRLYTHAAHAVCPATPSYRPIARPPVPAVSTPENLLLQWHYGDDATSMRPYSAWVTELAQDKPAFFWMDGWPTFHHEYTGAIAGVDNPNPARGNRIDGNSPISSGGYYSDLLSPAELQVREQRLVQYLSTFNQNTRPGLYMDLGTQFMGSPAGTGFWAFYNAWQNYTPLFDIGPKPADPYKWLRQSWSPARYSPGCGVEQNSDLDNVPMLDGLSFEYCPERHGFPTGDYRFSMNLLSSGFQGWWRTVLKYMAKDGYGMAYVDNALHRNCWNQECEDGYKGWLPYHYTDTEIERYLTETTSRIKIKGSPSFDKGWEQTPQGWENKMVSPWNNASIAPDADAVHGPLSLAATIGPGANYYSGNQIQFAIEHFEDDPAPATYLLGMYIRGDCQSPTFYLRPDNGAVYTSTIVPVTSSWTFQQIPFLHTPPNTPGVEIILNDGNSAQTSCKIWLDDLTIVKQGEQPTRDLRLWRPTDAGGHDLPLRTTASFQYWDSIVDQVLPVIKKDAAAANDQFWLITNSGGQQRRSAEVFTVERALLESERSPFTYPALAGKGSPPGTYVVVDPACTVYHDAKGTPLCEPDAALYPNACSCVSEYGVPVTSNLLVSNQFDFAWSRAQRFVDDEFAYHFHLLDRLRNPYKQDAHSAMLALAESSAFGGGAAIDLATDMEYWSYDHPATLSTERDNLDEVKRDFFSWVNKHAALFDCLTSAATVGIVVHHVHGDEASLAGEAHTVQLADQLAAAGLTYDVISEAGLTPENLARYRVLVYDSVPRISAYEAGIVKDYLMAGGIVVAADTSGKFDEDHRLWAANSPALWPPAPVVPGVDAYVVGSGRLLWKPVTDLGNSVLGVVPDAVMFPNLSPAERATTRVAVWAAPDHTVVHVLNYGVPLAIQGGTTPGTPWVHALNGVPQPVTVRVPLSNGFVPFTADVYTPDPAGYQGSVPVVVASGDALVTVPAISIYTTIMLH